jgi:hypothetical protein
MRDAFRETGTTPVTSCLIFAVHRKKERQHPMLNNSRYGNGQSSRRRERHRSHRAAQQERSMYSQTMAALKLESHSGERPDAL